MFHDGVFTLALTFSTITLLASLFFSHSIYRDVTTIWGELDKEMENFKAQADDLWIDMVRMGSGSAANRIRRQAYGGYGATGTNTGYIPSNGLEKSTGSGNKGSGYGSSTGACKCNSANHCPAGPGGVVGEKGTDGPDGSDGIPGLDGLDAENVKLVYSSSCFNCPTGAPGNQGPPGAPGIRGMRGARGRPGQTGRDGHPGLPGEIGPIGAPGDNGEAGTPGPKGNDEEQLIGSPGPRGPRGDPGAEGPTGYPGDFGAPGRTGIEGMSGYPGYPGMVGEEGPEGPPGLPGQAGRDATYCPCPEHSSSALTGYTNTASYWAQVPGFSAPISKPQKNVEPSQSDQTYSESTATPESRGSLAVYSEPASTLAAPSSNSNTNEENQHEESGGRSSDGVPGSDGIPGGDGIPGSDGLPGSIVGPSDDSESLVGPSVVRGVPGAPGVPGGPGMPGGPGQPGGPGADGGRGGDGGPGLCGTPGGDGGLGGDGGPGGDNFDAGNGGPGGDGGAAGGPCENENLNGEENEETTIESSSTPLESNTEEPTTETETLEPTNSTPSVTEVLEPTTVQSVSETSTRKNISKPNGNPGTPGGSGIPGGSGQVETVTAPSTTSSGPETSETTTIPLVTGTTSGYQDEPLTNNFSTPSSKKNKHLTTGSESEPTSTSDSPLTSKYLTGVSKTSRGPFHRKQEKENNVGVSTSFDVGDLLLTENIGATGQFAQTMENNDSKNQHLIEDSEPTKVGPHTTENKGKDEIKKSKEAHHKNEEAAPVQDVEGSGEDLKISPVNTAEVEEQHEEIHPVDITNIEDKKKRPTNEPKKRALRLRFLRS